MTDDLTARIDRLEQIEAIKRLKALYCRYSDEPEFFGRFADLFTEDAILNEPPLEYLEGREAIRESGERYCASHRFSRHYATTPHIEVDGNRARGTWQALLISTYETDDGELMLWGSGEYREEYVCIDGEWKFSRIDAIGRWMTSFDEPFTIDPGDIGPVNTGQQRGGS